MAPKFGTAQFPQNNNKQTWIHMKHLDGVSCEKEPEISLL